MKRTVVVLWPWLALAVVLPLAAALMPYRYFADAAYLLLFIPLLLAAMVSELPAVVAMTVILGAARFVLEWMHQRYLPTTPGWGQFLAAAAAPVALYVVLAWTFLFYRRRQAKLQAQLLAQARLEMMGQLAGGLAHDINNVLAVILGTLQLAQTDNAERLSDSLRADLEVAMDAARRGAKLVEQMMHAPAGDHEQMEPIDLAAVIADAVRHIRPALGPGIEVQFEPAADTLPVRGNATSLYQLLLNLTTNARDAMDGQGRIVLRTERRRLDPGEALRHNAHEGGYAVLSVTDFGRGMTSKTLGRVFRPFFTTKPPGQGTGLGLVVVSHIARQHGGFVEVESELAKGTTFRVWLPLHRT